MIDEAIDVKVLAEKVSKYFKESWVEFFGNLD